jgi:hypothetical protein
LNLYGFKRVSKGIDVGAYYHTLFLKGHSDMAKDVRYYIHILFLVHKIYLPNICYRRLPIFPEIKIDSDTPNPEVDTKPVVKSKSKKSIVENKEYIDNGAVPKVKKRKLMFDVIDEELCRLPTSIQGPSELDFDDEFTFINGYEREGEGDNIHSVLSDVELCRLI